MSKKPRRTGRKTAVGLVGALTIAVGVVMLPLPGPGTLVILGGISTLGTEFPAARRMSDKAWRAVGTIIRSGGHTQANSPSRSAE